MLHILATASGPRTMNANQSLAQLLQKAQNTLRIELQFGFKKKGPHRYSAKRKATEAVNLKAAELEKRREVAEKLLLQKARKIVSVGETSVPSAKKAGNQYQSNFQQIKIELLETQVASFGRQIKGLNEEFEAVKGKYEPFMLTPEDPEEPAAEQSLLKKPKTAQKDDLVLPNLLSTPEVPYASYSETMLKVFSCEVDYDDEDAVEENLKRWGVPSHIPPSSEVPPHPPFIHSMLTETAGLLKPLASHHLRGTFGRGGQGTVYRAVRALQWPKKGKVQPLIALKIVPVNGGSHRATAAEVRFSSRHFQDHPNVLHAEKASLFRALKQSDMKYFLALAFEVMVDGCLGLYYLCAWTEPNLACAFGQVLTGLAYIHSKVSVF